MKILSSLFLMSLLTSCSQMASKTQRTPSSENEIICKYLTAGNKYPETILLAPGEEIRSTDGLLTLSTKSIKNDILSITFHRNPFPSLGEPYRGETSIPINSLKALGHNEDISVFTREDIEKNYRFVKCSIR